MTEEEKDPGAQHRFSGGPAPEVEEPPFSERARTLVYRARVGSLSTISRRVAGHPFGSVAPYGLDNRGQPTFLISTMAMHTQNLIADARAGLLVTQPGWTDDPLAGARATLVGEARTIADADVAAVRDDYLRRHPNARNWIDFGDFGFYRLEVADLYYVAGFGAMGWIAAAEYAAAEADPLADSEAGILQHMNDDHRDALLLYCRAFAATEADEATMVAIDRLGFRVRARSGDRLTGLRINFPRQVRTPQAAREVLVEMVRQARSQSPGRAPR